MIKLLVSILIILVSLPDSFSSDIILKNKCDQEICVEMTLNWGDKKPLFKKTDGKSISYSIYHFLVKGKLDGKQEQNHKVQFEAFIDGIDCSDFGQGSVAVLGLNKLNPILETSMGQLEVTDGSLSVGCKDCIKLVDTKSKKEIKKYNSPSWDLSQTDSAVKFFTNDEELFISKRKKCINITPRGLFKKSDKKYCNPEKKLNTLKLFLEDGACV